MSTLANQSALEDGGAPRKSLAAPVAFVRRVRFQTWMMVVTFLLVVAASLTLWRGSPLSALRFMSDNLPLTLPILTVVLSVLLRFQELADFDGWLRLPIPFALGLVNFAIWVLVTSEGVPQYIVINNTQVLDKTIAIPLVLISLGWAASCSVITALAEKASEKKRLWQVCQVFLLALSVVCVIAPFHLLEDKSTVEKNTGRSFDSRQFIVSIPYRDASLNQHLGRSADPITESFVARHITAKSPSEAIEKAMAMMQTQDLAFNGRPVSDRRSNIEPLENLIVAQEER